LKLVFRMEGFLANKNNYDKYFILATAPNTGVIYSNAKTRSANTQTSKFYRKLSSRASGLKFVFSLILSSNILTIS
jgi:hypothetical protein